MLRIVVLGLLVVGWSSLAEAKRARVDALSSFGMEDSEQAKSFMMGLLREAGFEPQLAMADHDPCGRVPSCHVERGKRGAAAVSMHVVITQVGDEYAVSLYSVRVDSGAVVVHHAQLASLELVDEGLAAALRVDLFSEPNSKEATPWVSWSLAGGSVVMGIGGTLAYLHARSLRDEFFDRHVNGEGEIVGVSPSDARAQERSAQRWALAGGLLLTAAAISGVSATVLFVKDPQGESPKPAGVSLSGKF